MMVMNTTRNQVKVKNVFIFRDSAHIFDSCKPAILHIQSLTEAQRCASISHFLRDSNI